MWFAHLLDMARQAHAIEQWEYEPKSFPLKYKYRSNDLMQSYTPDFRAAWTDWGEQWYEVKRGRIDQKYANKIVRFCRQYPEYTLVLVWYGPLPKARTRQGKPNKRWTYFDKVREAVDHVWQIKKGDL